MSDEIPPPDQDQVALGMRDYVKAHPLYRDLEAQLATIHGALSPLMDSSKDQTYCLSETCGQCQECAARTAISSTADAARAYEERIRAEEREACAKVAEETDVMAPCVCTPDCDAEFDRSGWQMVEAIAVAIRARGAK